MIEQLPARLAMVLAEAGPNNAPPNNPEWGKAAPTGLFVLLVFVVVCFFLFRSMNRHIKKVPTTFRAGAQSPTSAGQSAANQSAATVSATAGDATPTATTTATAAPAAATVSATQTKPRLGTPEEMLNEQQAKRREKVRKARQRTRRDGD